MTYFRTKSFVFIPSPDVANGVEIPIAFGAWIPETKDGEDRAKRLIELLVITEPQHEHILQRLEWDDNAF